MTHLSSNWRRVAGGVMGAWLLGATGAWSQDRYVAAGGSDTPPYTSWATAAHTISAAVGAASASDTVWLTNGTHTLSAEVHITKGVTVKGVDRDTTIVDGNDGGTFRCFYVEHASAVLDSLTIIRGGGGGISGGGIRMDSGTITNCTLRNCTGVLGGAVQMLGGLLTGSTLCNNTASAWGGAAYVNGGVIDGCLVTSNTSAGAGCNGAGLAMDNTGGGIVVRNSTITRNGDASCVGGGFYLYGPNTVTNCMISQNTAALGGGLALMQSGGAILGCTIVSNHCGNVGGGVWMASSAAALVERCQVEGNSADNFGGGICNYLGTVRDCLIAGNSALNDGGGVHLGNSGVSAGVMESCTVVRNYTSAGNGGGVYCTADASAITNCIVHYNDASGSGKNIALGGGAFGYSCSPDLTHDPSGTHNITNYPSFLNNGSGYGPANYVAGNYHLATNSACIDSAAELAWMTGAGDLDGSPRVLPAGGTPDIGAYEYGRLTGVFSASSDSAGVPVTTVFTASLSGTNTTGVYYRWDFNADGVWDAEGYNLQVVTNTYESVGTYSVALAVSNAASGLSSWTSRNCVQANRSLYVSLNGTHQSPYTNWVMAATNLPAALAEAAAGECVRVSNGTYTLSAEVHITKGVTVKGVDRDTTIVDGNAAGTFRCFYVEHASAVLDSLTIIGGGGSGISGGGVRMDSGTITNCTIRNCTGVLGGAIQMYGGLLTGSTLCNNTATAFGGGAFVNGGVVDGCLVTNNAFAGGTCNGGGLGVDNAGGGVVIKNSTIARNGDASCYGGGIYLYGPNTVTNCVISQNTAALGGGLVLMQSGGAILDCTIESNSCGNVGGGVWMASSAAALVYRCRVAWNRADNFGGGICNYLGTVRDCLIAGNTALNDGGGVHLGNSGVSAGVMESCTVVRNYTSSGTGGGVCCTPDASTITNCIVYYNDASGSGKDVVAGGGTFGYSCSPDLTAGVNHNITDSPGFKRNGTGYGAATYVAGDYDFRSSSACREAGLDQSWMAGATDLAGNPRVWPADGVVDIGAYEGGRLTGMVMSFK